MNYAIVSYHNMGGSGIVAYELGSELARQGHKVHFLGLEPPFRMNTVQDNIRFHTVEVKDYPVFTYPPYTLSLASHLYEVVERHDIDVIHCHYAVPHAVAGILARDMASKTVKVITTLHGTDITLVGSHPSFYNITRHAINQSDCVTAVSDWLCKKTEEVFKIEPGIIKRVFNFYNEENFNPDLTCECLEKRHSGHDIIVHASNLREVKQPLDLIHIFRQVVDRRGDKCRLWILGEGPRKYDMENLAREYGLEDQIEFFGAVNDPGLFFACADLFLLTSTEESFGLAALEAMACRTPVVAYGTGGIPEVVEDGVSGFLPAYKDIDAMARSCVKLLEDKELQASMKEAAYKRAQTHFSKDKIVQEYIECCQ